MQQAKVHLAADARKRCVSSKAYNQTAVKG